MGPILGKDRQFKVLMGYYACNPIKRGDLVFFRFSETLPPVARVVRALPGDKAEVRLTSDGHWEIWINKDAVSTEEGPFRLSDPANPPPLKSNLEDRGGTLNDDEYLLMTMRPPGTADSIRLGPTPGVQIVGKVIVLPEPQD